MAPFVGVAFVLGFRRISTIKPSKIRPQKSDGATMHGHILNLGCIPSRWPLESSAHDSAGIEDSLRAELAATFQLDQNAVEASDTLLVLP